MEQTFVSEEDAEISCIETFPELFPRNHSDNFGLKYALEFFAEQTYQIFDSRLEVGMVKTFEKSLIDLGPLAGLLKRALECKIVRDDNDGLVDDLQFFAGHVLGEEEIDVFVYDFGSGLGDRLFFRLGLPHI